MLDISEAEVKVEEVILVTENDEPIGVIDKSTAHVEGKLHRAFSVLVLNQQGELLLQQRAQNKHHSGGLWSNTCCGHPRPGESVEAAAHRRLHEEMGFDCTLSEIFSFVYRAEVGDGSIEHEYDHVFTGKFEGEPRLNLDEAVDWRWIKPATLRESLKGDSSHYTAWLGLIINNCSNRLL